MKAMLCKQFGPPSSLELTELPSPTPKPGQVVVAVRAAGANFPDTLMIEGKYQYKPPFPFAPGAEFSGVVSTLGEDVTQFKPGDAVMGLSTWGAFATEIAVDAARLVPLPAGTDFKLAASFGLTYGTSYHALVDRAQLRAGETLLVLGAAGGVGLAAVELGKILGARVIAAASSDDKLATCRRYGADECINYETEDLRDGVKRITGSTGVDVVYDPVGGKYAEPAVRSLAWKGRYLVVGFANGEIPKIPLNLVLLKGSALVGVFWGSFNTQEAVASRANTMQLLDWLRAGKIKPLISLTYPLARAAEALEALAARRVQGKAIIEMG